MIIDSLWLMFYGLLGVFGALALLYGAVKLMVVIFPKKKNKEE